jgi:hypothetical protein
LSIRDSNPIRGFGNDWLDGGSENEVLDGRENDDTLAWEQGADTFCCGSGVDTIKDYNETEGDTKSSDCENF